MLLPVFEFLDNNQGLAEVLVKPFTQENDLQDDVLVLSLVTVSSYILTHATSSASPRAVAYAHLSLNILLRLVQNPKVSSAFCQPRSHPIRLCRQVRSFPPDGWHGGSTIIPEDTAVAPGNRSSTSYVRSAGLVCVVVTTQPAQETRSELLHASFDPPLGALSPAVFADFLAFLFQSVHKNMSSDCLILAETWDPTGYAMGSTVLLRAGFTVAPRIPLD